MIKTITAIYERGMLRPTQSLNLPEHETVQLKIIARKKPAQSRWNRSEYVRALGVLEQQGLIQAAKPPRRKRRVSENRRRELARALSVGKPLSETIIAERDEKA